jgi:adenylate cyclase
LIALGIGIDRGLGLVGLVGSRERMKYDFVGRTVNVAARVQTLTRIHQADILVTEALRAEFDARFVLMPMPAEFVKGIAEPWSPTGCVKGHRPPLHGGRRQMTGTAAMS